MAGIEVIKSKQRKLIRPTNLSTALRTSEKTACVIYISGDFDNVAVTAIALPQQLHAFNINDETEGGGGVSANAADSTVLLAPPATAGGASAVEVLLGYSVVVSRLSKPGEEGAGYGTVCPVVGRMMLDVSAV